MLLHQNKAQHKTSSRKKEKSEQIAKEQIHLVTNLFN